MDHRRHSEEFKREAVRLAEREGISKAQTARELGINECVLYKWIKKFGTKPDGSKLDVSEHEELIRLRRENAVLREEREILKKAAAYFAKEHR